MLAVSWALWHVAYWYTSNLSLRETTDTLRIHVQGLLASKPEWKGDLLEFQVEGAWMTGAWEELRSLVAAIPPESTPTAIAHVLVAMQSEDKDSILATLDRARMVLGDPISAAGSYEYRRSYSSMLNLHVVHEMETIQSAVATLTPDKRQRILGNSLCSLRLRLDAIQPSYRARERLISMHRVMFTL